jgi:uroporphyrinogen-III synthase
VAYEVVIGPESSRASLERALGDGLYAAVFTSGSTVRGFARLIGDPALALAGARVVCIGPVTAEVARRAGLLDVRVAAARTPAAIVAALANGADG